MHKIIAILSFFLLINCGYEPIYSKKNIENIYNFSISSIGFSGENSVNQNLKNNLINFINIKSKPLKYDLVVYSNKIKTITSKNKKGNPEIFNMKIVVIVDIYQNGEIKSKKKFGESFEYKNKSSKFELKKYEQTIIQNITSRLSKNIIDHLYSIK